MRVMRVMRVSCEPVSRKVSLTFARVGAETTPATPADARDSLTIPSHPREITEMISSFFLPASLFASPARVTPRDNWMLQGRTAA